MRLGGEDRYILIQKRVRLVQSGHFKKYIEELNKDYNGSLKVKEKHKQLVYVLNQIKSKVEF